MGGLLLAGRAWKPALALAAIAQMALDSEEEDGGPPLALVFDAGVYDRTAWENYLRQQEVAPGSGVYRIGSEVLKVEVGNSVRADGLRWFASAVTTPRIDPTALIRTLLARAARDVREARTIAGQNLNVRIVLLTANNTLVEGRAAVEAWAAAYRGAVELVEVRAAPTPEPTPPLPAPMPAIPALPQALPASPTPAPWSLPLAEAPPGGWAAAPTSSPPVSSGHAAGGFAPPPPFGQQPSWGAPPPVEEWEPEEFEEEEGEEEEGEWPWEEDGEEAETYYRRHRRPPPSRKRLSPLLLPAELGGAFALHRDLEVRYFKLGRIGKIFKSGLKAAAKIAPAVASFVPGVGPILGTAASAIVGGLTKAGAEGAKAVTAEEGGFTKTPQAAIDTAVAHAFALAKAFSPREAVLHLFSAIPELGQLMVALSRGPQPYRDWAPLHDACHACGATADRDWRGALPEGEFYRSQLVSASVRKDLGRDVFGMVHLNRFPFPVAISGAHGPVRARIALAHELAHVANKVYKMGIPHSAVHDLGVFYATEGLPALRALEAHVGASS